MSEQDFEWNPAKAAMNVRKHRVSFAEARTVFDDLNVIIKPDTEHSEDEERSKALGFSSKGRLLVVVFTERGHAIRIISARKATDDESESYGER